MTIIRDAELASAVTLDWSVEGQTNSADYEEFKGQLSFAPGESTAVIIIASPLSTRSYTDSTFDVVLTPVSGPLLTGLMRCGVKVENDIAPAKVGFAVQTSDQNQSDKKISLKLERTGFTFGDATVNWKIETHLGDAKFMENQSVTFKSGESEKQITFDLPTRPQTEKNEKYIFELLNLDGDAELGSGRCEVNVHYDIQWPVVEFTDFELSARQSDGEITIPVLRSSADSMIKVNWRENGERQFGNEWRKHAGTLEYPNLVGIQNILLPVCEKPTASKSCQVELQLTGADDDQEFLLGDHYKCLISLLQDIPFPKVSFTLPELSLKQSSGIVRIPLQRTTNMRDDISVNWFVKSDNPAYANLKGQVHFGDGQSEGVFEFKLPEFPQTESATSFSIELDRDNEMCQIGSVPDLSMTVENDVEPSAVEVVGLETALVRSAGSVPVQLRRTGFADCPVTVSVAVMLENFEILHTSVTFAAGEMTASFEIPIDAIPRKTDVDNYRIIITDIISDHPTSPPDNETVFQIRNDVARSQVKISSADQSINQSYGKANFKMERFGNLDGELTANYSIFGGQLDGHKGSVTIGDGISEIDFEVDLPSNPLAADSSKLRVEIDDMDGFSCPTLIGGGVEFEMIHDIQPTSILIVQPENVKQSDGSFRLKIIREGNNDDCVTIPYTITSNLDSEPVTGVVFFDAGGNQLDQELKIDFDMAPCDDAEETYTLVFDEPRGGLQTAIAQREFSICVEQDVQIPVIEFNTVAHAARQSDELMNVNLRRRHNQHGSIMIKYSISSLSGGKEQRWEKFNDGMEFLELAVDLPQFPLQYDSDEYVLELLELDGVSLPRLGENTKCVVRVENDLKATVLTMQETKFNVKQTDKTVDITVKRLAPNLTGVVKFGWHVVDGDTTHILDFFYERQRGTVTLKDGQTDCHIVFKLLQVPQKESENTVRLVMEPPVGGRCTELVEKEAIIHIENDVPRPLVQLDLEQSQVKQTNGDVSLPVSRSRFMGGRILIPWYLDVSNEHSPYYGVGGREMIDEGESSTEIKFKLPNFPIWAESNKLMLRLGGIGGDHFPEADELRSSAKVFVNNDIQAEMLSFLTNERLLKQSDGDIILHVNRSGYLNTELRSGYHVKSLNATFGAIRGELFFRQGDVDKTVTIPISQDPSAEEHTIFTIALSVPTLVNIAEQESPSRRKPKLGKHPVMAITLLNDIERPTASLPVEKITVRQTDKIFSIGVVRGGQGECIVAWKILNARHGSPYENLTGNAKFTGDSQLFKVEFDLPQMPQNVDEDAFMIQLLDPKGQNNPMLGTIHAADVTVINDIKPALISFTGDKLTISQSEKKVLLPLCRLYHNSGEAKVTWKVRSKHGHKSPYHEKEGHVTFEDKDELKNIELVISQLPVMSLDLDELLVSLESIDENKTETQFGKIRNCNVDLKYDLKPATFNFKKLDLSVRQTDGKTELHVVRTGNLSGAANLTFKQSCRSNPFYDQVYQVRFLDGDLEKKIEVTLDPTPAKTDEDDIDLDLASVNDEEVVIAMTCTIRVLNDIKPTTFDFEVIELVAHQSESEVLLGVVRSSNLENLASIRWRVVSAEHPFELAEGRIAFDEQQQIAKIRIPILQSMGKNDGYFTDIELFEPKGERAMLGSNIVAGVVVKMDLTFFELGQIEHNFHQSAQDGRVEVVRLNNISQAASLAYKTSSPAQISDWNSDSPCHVTFEATSASTFVIMEFDPEPINTTTEKVTLKLLPDLHDKQRSPNKHTGVITIEYDVEPTKINFCEPISVASKRLGKIELPITCVAKNRPQKSKITVSWHSEGLRKEQQGTVSFIGDQVDHVIPIILDTIKVQEFEVYIREVTGASYVSITLPKCKVKVVDDCPTYRFTESRVRINQSDGDIAIVLSSQIAAVGKAIAWKATPLLPASVFHVEGITVVDADGTASIRITMPTLPQDLSGEEFRVTVDLADNKGIVTDVAAELTCCVVVTYDIHPAAIMFETEKQTIHRRGNKSVQIPVIRTLNLKGDVMIVYQINNEMHNLVMPSDMAEAVIEVPLEQIPLQEAVTEIRMTLVTITAGTVPAELGEIKSHFVSIVNDIPLPMFEFKTEGTKVRQSDGIIAIPVVRTNAVATGALIAWKVANASTESPMLNMKGLLKFDPRQNEQAFELHLPQMPNLVREEMIEIELQAVRGSDIGNTVVHCVALHYDIPFPRIDVSLTEAVVETHQSSQFAKIYVTRSESPIPTAIEVSWIAKPDTAGFPVQTGVLEMHEPGRKAVDLALPSKPAAINTLGIDFELVKADIHTNDSRQTCSIGKSKSLIKIDMDKEQLYIHPQATEIVVKQSQRVAEVRLSRTLDTVSCQLPWKTVSASTRYNQLSGIVEFAKGRLEQSIIIKLPEADASDDEEEFTLHLLNPLCDDEVFIPSPAEVKVRIQNDLISNQVGFKVDSTKINVLQSEGSISVPLERTGCVDTVSWVKWKIDGPPQFEGLNSDGCATFQSHECDGVVMINLPQKPINEPYAVMAITLCEPGALIPECRPIIGPNNTVIIQITNDVAPPKIEFPLTQLTFTQSNRVLEVSVRRVGYQLCEVECDWNTNMGHTGHIRIPDQEDHAVFDILIPQEPNVNNPVEMMEIHLTNPQSNQTSPVLGADKCFVKIINDICKFFKKLSRKFESKI